MADLIPEPTEETIAAWRGAADDPNRPRWWVGEPSDEPVPDGWMQVTFSVTPGATAYARRLRDALSEGLDDG